MIQRILAGATIATLGMGMGATANAEGWKAGAWEQHVKVTGPSPEEYTYDMYSLHTTDAEEPGLMFSCSTRFGLNVVYSFKGVDFADLMMNSKAKRARPIPVRIWVADDRLELTDFLVRRHDKVISNMKAHQSATAMRALLRDNPIRIKAFGYFDVRLNIPSLDAEVGKFLETCPVANDIAESVRDENSS